MFYTFIPLGSYIYYFLCLNYSFFYQPNTYLFLEIQLIFPGKSDLLASDLESLMDNCVDIHAYFPHQTI